MEFEDRLRAAFRQADRSIEDQRLEYVAAVDRGKRLRVMRFATAVAAAAVLIGGGFAGANAISGGEAPIAPVGPEESETNFTDDPTPPPPADRGDCSAAQDAHDVSAQPELPSLVLGVRMRIVEEAWDCDFEGLEELAGTPFNYDNDGNAGSAADYWRKLEIADDPVTKVLVRLLDTKPAVAKGGSGANYVWPAAAASARPTEAQWAELERAFDGIYIPEYVDKLRELGFYNGYRIEITADGEWTVFALGEAAAAPVECEEAMECPSPPPDEEARFEEPGMCSGYEHGARTGIGQPGLPAAVDEVRRDIITRTWRCDYAGLEEIALSDDDPPFEYVSSAKVEARPADQWRNLEEGGEPMGAVTRILAHTLQTTPAKVMSPSLGLVYVWPEAALEGSPSEEAWDELYEVYDKKQVDEMRSEDDFSGYTVVIAEDGDWIEFVAD